MDQTSELGLPLFLILCGVLGMLLLAIAIIIFFMVYQKRLFAQQENIRKIETAYQKDMLQYAFEAQEAERKRIASDLHDEIGSMLSAIRIYVHQLNPSLKTHQYQEIKTETTDLIDTSIDHIRGISHNLFPPNLDRLGLFQTVKDFCHRIEKLNKLNIELNYPEKLDLTKPQELAVYRILQELTNNTLKHAQANKIEVSFRTNPQQFKMTYKDNGKGFRPKPDHERPNGLGLKSIESRGNAIGANTSIQSKEGEGMSFELLLSKN